MCRRGPGVPAAACTPPAGMHWSPIPRPRALAVCACVCACVCAPMCLSPFSQPPCSCNRVPPPANNQRGGQEPCHRYDAPVALPAGLHPPHKQLRWGRGKVTKVGEIDREVVSYLHFRFSIFAKRLTPCAPANRLSVRGPKFSWLAAVALHPYLSPLSGSGPWTRRRRSRRLRASKAVRGVA